MYSGLYASVLAWLKSREGHGWMGVKFPSIFESRVLKQNILRTIHPNYEPFLFWTPSVEIFKTFFYTKRFLKLLIDFDKKKCISKTITLVLGSQFGCTLFLCICTLIFSVQCTSGICAHILVLQLVYFVLPSKTRTRPPREMLRNSREKGPTNSGIHECRRCNS
jgi:hypothetical protein